MSASVWWPSSVASKDNTRPQSATSCSKGSLWHYSTCRCVATSQTPSQERQPGSWPSLELRDTKELLSVWPEHMPQLCPFSRGKHISLFQISLDQLPPWTRSSGGEWQPAQQPPLTIHSPTAKLSSTPASHPLINKLFSVSWAGFLLQPCLLHICPLHSSNAPVFPVYKLSAFKARKLDKNTHSSSGFPLHKHARTRQTFLSGSPKPLDHSVSN